MGSKQRLPDIMLSPARCILMYFDRIVFHISFVPIQRNVATQQLRHLIRYILRMRESTGRTALAVQRVAT